MKVRKEVSLTPRSYEIASRMQNFSQWVRMSLNAYDRKEDVGTVLTAKVRWAKAAHHLASALLERALELDENFTIEGYEEDLVAGLIAKAYNQTTLEEFE